MSKRKKRNQAERLDFIYSKEKNKGGIMEFEEKEKNYILSKLDKLDNYQLYLVVYETFILIAQILMIIAVLVKL